MINSFCAIWLDDVTDDHYEEEVLMTLYQKVLAVFSILRSAISGKVDNSELAPSFSTSARYSEGALVMRGNVLYRCTSEHTGEWDMSHFSRTNMGQNIPKKTSDIKNDSGYISASDIIHGIDGIIVDEHSTQRDLRVAVQGILSAIRSLGQVSCLALALASANAEGAIGNGVKWENVSPTSMVYDVVQDSYSGEIMLDSVVHNVSTGGVFVLKDHAVNILPFPKNAQFLFQEKKDGRARCLYVYLSLTNGCSCMFPTNLKYFSPDMGWLITIPDSVEQTNDYFVVMRDISQDGTTIFWEQKYLYWIQPNQYEP